jgi:hypothetical protein
MRQLTRSLFEFFRQEDSPKLVEYVVVTALIIVGAAQLIATVRRDASTTPAQSGRQAATVGS